MWGRNRSRFEGAKEEKNLKASWHSLQAPCPYSAPLGPSLTPRALQVRFNLLRAGQAMGGGREVHVQVEHITATHCWPPSVSQSEVGAIWARDCPWSAQMHQQPQHNGALGLPVNHGLVEDSSHPEHSPSPDWFNQVVPLRIRNKMSKRLINIDYCSAPRPAFWLTFTWHQPEHLDVFQVMRVTALSSVNKEVSRHLQKAICTSRQVKRLAFQWQVSPWR